MSRLARLCAAAAALALAAPALAQEGPCPPVCAGTGHEIYAEVWWIGRPNGDIHRISAPFFLDRSFTDAGGFARGIVDLAAGTLKAHVISQGEPGAAVTAHATDRFTVGGLAPGTPVFVNAVIIADGLGSIALNGNLVDAILSLGFPGGANDFDRALLQAGNHVDAATPFAVDLAANLGFVATVGTPFDFGYSLRIAAGSGPGGAELDFLHTARLGFELPAGATITSVGGFGSAVTAVPEPASLALVAAGLVALMVGRPSVRRARSRTPC
jgi:hypothetical protein